MYMKKWKLKVNRGEVLKIKDGLVIMMNKKCGYGCEHCLYDCSPDSNIQIDQERLFEILNNTSKNIKKSILQVVNHLKILNYLKNV